MLVANVDKVVVRQMYPEQFDAGKERFVSEILPENTNKKWGRPKG